MKKEFLFLGFVLLLAGIIIAEQGNNSENNQSNQNNQSNLSCQENDDCQDNYECKSNVCIKEDKEDNEDNETEDNNNETDGQTNDDHEDNETEDEQKICCLRTITRGNESYQKYNFIEKEDCLEFKNNLTKTSQIVNDDLCKKRKLNKTEQKEEVRERQRIKFEHKTGITCPNDCICTGVVMKCILEDGTREMNVYSSSGNLIIQIKDSNFSTNVTLYKDDNGTLYGVFDGKEKKIKFFPEEIREKIKEKIKSNLKDEEINLDENGHYDVQGKKKARFLGFIPVKEKVRIEVDPETGAITKTKSSWWGFLARDVKEE